MATFVEFTKTASDLRVMKQAMAVLEDQRKEIEVSLKAGMGGNR